jgi:hypothetical protein
MTMPQTLEKYFDFICPGSRMAVAKTSVIIPSIGGLDGVIVQTTFMRGDIGEFSPKGIENHGSVVSSFYDLYSTAYKHDPDLPQDNSL